MILVSGPGKNGPSTPSSYPSNCAGVIAVGAYGFYGNKGSRPDLRTWSGSATPENMYLVGPGEDLLNFRPGTDEAFKADGTSGAAAITSGSLALVRAAFPDMPSRQLVARVLATASRLDGRTQNGVRDPTFELGSIRPRGAIEKDVPADGQAAPPAPGAPADPADPGPDDTTETAPPSGPSETDRQELLLIGIVALGVVGTAVVTLLGLRLTNRRAAPVGGPHPHPGPWPSPPGAWSPPPGPPAPPPPPPPPGSWR